MPNNRSGNIRFANSSFQVVQNSGSTQPVDYSHEEERLKSFVPWPAHYPVDPIRLAKAGFYYTGNEDEVICFSCHGHIKDWNYGDVVQKKHATLFPNCDFVNGRSKNVPVIYRKKQTPSSSDVKPKSPSPKYLDEIIKHIDYDKMKSLNERLKTFKECDWPSHEVDFIKLAKAGFFYLGIEDKVQCPFCKGIVSHWEVNDDPFEEHNKYFAWCDYLSDTFKNQNLEKLPKFHSESEDLCGNMQKQILEQSSVKSKLIDPDQEHLNLEQLGIHLYSSPAHPQQASLSARLRSFTAWPRTAPVSKESLAEAGFFYIGIGDHTKCFHCNAGLCNWEIGDDPWVEHAKWFCNCHYLRLNKGDEFVKNVLKSHVPDNHMEDKDDNVSTYFCSEPLIAKVDEAMKSTMVQYVLDSGLFPHYIVRVAVLRQIEKTGSSFSDLNELCSSVSHLKEEMEMELEKKKSTEILNLNELDIRKCTIAEMNEGQSYASAVAKKQSEDSAKKDCESFDCGSTKTKLVRRATEDKGEISRDYCLCKICMDKEVGVVFLPCGHLLSCSECAGAMSLCPMCRMPIKAVVKAILS